MTTLSSTELVSCINELLSCKAFELHMGNGADFYIPYMMNDALECYLLLENGRMTGSYLSDCRDDMSVEYVLTEKSPALIFHQGRENVFTLWFDNCYRVLNLYRYDQIGHFWVKGQEQWRQLVYIIGTIHDKYNYLGNAVCNEEELALLPLMEFAPFRYYSPLHESLDEYYQETPKGTQCMINLAKEIGDNRFLTWLKLYQLCPSRLTARLIAALMNYSSRQPLYELIYTKMQKASKHYPERSYSEDLNRKIIAERSAVSEKLLSQGFSGEYPRFYKENVQILATEEHPFTILESDTFNFKIQLMVSRTKKKNHSLNAGFFKKKGNHCDIITIDKSDSKLFQEECENERKR